MPFASYLVARHMKVIGSSFGEVASAEAVSRYINPRTTSIAVTEGDNVISRESSTGTSKYFSLA